VRSKAFIGFVALAPWRWTKRWSIQSEIRTKAGWFSFMAGGPLVWVLQYSQVAR
jgi:hypothetical protein